MFVYIFNVQANKDSNGNKHTNNTLFILGSNTVVFISTSSGISLLGSHLHGNSGASVAFAECQQSCELLSWFTSVKNFQYVLGTVTNVKFHYRGNWQGISQLRVLT